MLQQALGTMLKAKQPRSWKIDATGRSYPFAVAKEGVPTGAKTGAWVVTEPITPVNAEDAAVGGNTNLKAKK